MNTPLDSLKNTVLRGTNALEGIANGIAGSLCGHDHERDLEWMDSAKLELWFALAEHIPGITINKGLVEMTPDALQHVHHYDDGSLIDEYIDIWDGDGRLHYFRRLDGPRDEFIAKFGTPPRRALNLAPAFSEVK